MLSSNDHFRLLASAPYAHYELATNITIDPINWTPVPYFTGTLDGGGYTLTVSEPLFTHVLGSRTGYTAVVNTSEHTSNPQQDNASDKKMGTVSDLKVVLAANITTGIFGNVYNSTFISTTLTGGTYTAALTSARQATFINAFYGSGYVYNCSSNVSSTMTAACEDSATLIGHIDGKVLVDKCSSTGGIAIAGTNISGRSAFIGSNISNSGVIQNCFATGTVTGNGTPKYSVFGNSSSSNLYNIVWSDSSTVNGTPASSRSGVPTRITEWGTTGNGKSTYAITASSIAVSIPLPTGLNYAFASASASDFSATSANTAVATVGSPTVSGGNVQLTVTKISVISGRSTYIKVTHAPTGLTAYFYVTTSAGPAAGDDGYINIASVDDLVYIGEHQDDNNFAYLSSAFRLVADIDMSGETFVPLGYRYDSNTSTYLPFKGIFTGVLDTDGSPKYTISNLSVGEAMTTTSFDYVGMFAYVDHSAQITVNAVATDAFIGNFNLDSVTSRGNNYVGILIGKGDCVDVRNVGITDSTLTSGVMYLAGAWSSPSASNGFAGIGGIVGNLCANGANPSTIADIVLNNVTITSAYNSDLPAIGIGGIVGLMGANNLTVTGADITDLSIIGSNNPSGSVLGNKYSTSGTVTISDAEITDPSILSNMSVGGIVGNARGRVNISTSSVNGTVDPTADGATPSAVIETTSKDTVNVGSGTYTVYGGAGGIAGYLNNSVLTSITDCTVDKTYVYAHFDVEQMVSPAGGIASATSGTVSDCTVSSSKIYGISCAGVVAVGAASGVSVAIDACSVNASKIIASMLADRLPVAGGIFADTYRAASASTGNVTITDCTVDTQTDVSSTGTVAGGIVGRANPVSGCIVDISGCKVYSSVSAELPTSTAGGVGGILGLSESGLLNNLHIETCLFGGKITAPTAVGGIIGRILSGLTAYSNTSSYVARRSVVTGSFTVTNDTTQYSAIAFGNISSSVITSNYTSAISDIYFSSYRSDMLAYGTAATGVSNANAAGTFYDVYKPNAGSQLASDITLNNANVQTPSVVSPFPTSYGSYLAFSCPLTNKWKSDNSELVEVKNDSIGSLTIQSVRKGNAIIYVDYSATFLDESIVFRAGFKATSTTRAPLSTAMIEGESYYLIENMFDLDAIRDYVSNNGSGVITRNNFAIVNDINIDVSEFTSSAGTYYNGFIPIGIFTGGSNSEAPFRGKIIGYDLTNEVETERTITNMVINAGISESANYVGFFSFVDGTSALPTLIKNIRFVNVKAVSADNDAFMGAVVGYARGEVDFVNVTVENPNLSGAYHCGGIVGGFSTLASTTPSFVGCGTVANSATLEAAIGASTISSQYNAGGILGLQDGMVATDTPSATTTITTCKAPVDYSGITVSGLTISQSYIVAVSTTTLPILLKLGAGGISTRIYGTVSANGAVRNTVDGCTISGASAGGAFASSVGETDIQAVDVSDTSVSSTDISVNNQIHTAAGGLSAGGILAKVESTNLSGNAVHDVQVSDCSVDEDCVVKAMLTAGGIIAILRSALSTAAMPTYAKIDGCSTFAEVESVSLLAPVNTTLQQIRGAGGIIGAISLWSDYISTNITNCVVGGKLIGRTSVGGLVGTMGATGNSNSLADLSSDTDHFAENCVISASFYRRDMTDNTVLIDSFAQALGITASTNAVVYIGVVFGRAVGNANGGTTTAPTYYPFPAASITNPATHPFYNIFYSGYNTNIASNGISPLGTSANGVFLFGKNNLNTDGRLNTPTFTTNHVLDKYCYDLNYQVNHYGYTSSAALRLTAVGGGGTLAVDGNNASGTPIDSTTLNIPVTGSDISSTYPEQYSYATGSTINSFTAQNSASANVKVGRDIPFVLSDAQVVLSDPTMVGVEMRDGVPYIVNHAHSPTDSVTLVLTYENGIKLSIPVQVSYDSSCTWGSGTSSDPYLIWGYNNLSLLTSANSNKYFKQMFSVYFQVPDAATATDLNNITLGEFLTSAELTALESVNGLNADNEDVNFKTTYDLDDDGLGDVLLSSVAGELFTTDDNNTGVGAIFNGQTGTDTFTGSYVVKTEDASMNSGFAPYSVNNMSLNPSSECLYSGFFSRINGATVTGLIFNNCSINVQNTTVSTSYAGILAGISENSAINGVTVNDAEVISIRRTSPASCFAGAVFGSYFASTLQNVTVTGSTVLAASKMTSTSTDVRVYAGGVAGEMNTAATGVSVSDSFIYTDRQDTDNYFVAISGGVAGKATGSITTAEVENTTLSYVAVTNTLGDFSYTPDNGTTYSSSKKADIIGGVVGMSGGNLTVSFASFTGGTIRAFDCAGGIIGVVPETASCTVSVTGSTVGDTSPVTISAMSNKASVVSLTNRRLYASAGGVVGCIAADAGNSIVSSLFVSDSHVNANVITSASVSNNGIGNNCGGILGCIEDGVPLEGIIISGSSSQGTVKGNAALLGTGTTIEKYGNGGIIGNIRSFVNKTTSTNKMINNCITSCHVAGFNPSAPDNELSTYSGKIIGRLSQSVGATLNFADATAAQGSTLALTDYISNVYLSSYPQNLAAYGDATNTLTSHQSALSTYIDINTVTVVRGSETFTGENTLMVDNTGYVSYASPDYANGSYTKQAMVVYESGTTVSEDRLFRLAYHGFDVAGMTINFAGSFGFADGTNFAVTYDDTTFSSTSSYTYELNSQSYNYACGVINISVSNTAGSDTLYADMNYGLQVSVGALSVDIAGSGTSNDPYQIARIDQLPIVRALPDAYYLQMNDLNFTTADYTTSTSDYYLKGFASIGKSLNTSFTGSYDGGGFKITNLYINNGAANTGFFGYAGNGSTKAVIKNLHIELLPNNALSGKMGGIRGTNSVAGLVGYVRNADITNCSVVGDDIIGSGFVGGLVGTLVLGTVDSCFTTCNVHVFTSTATTANTAGGIIGFVSGNVNMYSSFATGYIENANTANWGGNTGGLIGSFDSNGATLTVSDCISAATISEQGYVSMTENNEIYAGLAIGYHGLGTVNANNVLILGTRAMMSADKGQYFCAFMGGIPASTALSGSSSYIYYDSTILGTATRSVDGVTSSGTATLSGGAVSFGATAHTTWTQAAGKYPTIDMDDTYSDNYAALCSVVLNANSARETADSATYNGFFYPVSLTKEDGYSFASSKLDLTDTVDYPQNIDTGFYGIGTDKQTDLLFEDVTVEGKTTATVYRNVFGNTKYQLKNDGTVFDNNSVGYSQLLPTVDVTHTVGDQTCVRRIVIPLEYRANGSVMTYPIATARQLRAISDSAESVAGSKFASLYTNAQNSFYVTHNINLDATVPFNPIIGFGGHFDGGNFTISNLTINGSTDSEIGMFRSICGTTSTTVIIKDLTLRDVRINGANNVGALVGAIVNPSSNSALQTRIENCHVVTTQGVNDAHVTGTGYNVGGLVGSIGYSSNDDNINTDREYGIFESSSDVPVSGLNVVGGLVGMSESPIENCFSTGSVTATIVSSGSAKIATMHDKKGTEYNYNYTFCYAGGTATSMAQRAGIGGLVGVISKINLSDVYVTLMNCFASGEVNITSIQDIVSTSYYGIGGLAGIIGKDSSNASIYFSSCFSSGNVNVSDSDFTVYGSVGTANLGIGGVVGISDSMLGLFYSSASLNSSLGNLADSAAGTVVLGFGGLVGIANKAVQNAYTSGATLTYFNGEPNAGFSYGTGALIGVAKAGGCSELYFDYWNSGAEHVAGLDLGSNSFNDENSKKTTREMSQVSSNEDKFLTNSEWGYSYGAYPFLKLFFRNEVSLDIFINALLSIVAMNPHELDTKAASGEGISMALTAPTEIEYSTAFEEGEDSYYVGSYQYSWITTQTSMFIDTSTNTVAPQRSDNRPETMDIIVQIETKNDSQTQDTNSGRTYTSIASRTLSKLCARMHGTQTDPYLITSQEDLEHVGMTSAEWSALDTNSYYKDWVTPLDDNFAPISGKVYYQLMGYVTVNADNENPYVREIPTLTGQSYTINETPYTYSGFEIDGKGYYIRDLNLSASGLNNFITALDSNSAIYNMTFDGAELSDGTSLIGTIDTTSIVNDQPAGGFVDGVNVLGDATGIGTAGIAATNNGLIKGCLVDLDCNIPAAKAYNHAGIALTNSSTGIIEMCCAAGDITAAGAENVGGLVRTNNGTIRQSFTMGNMQLGTSVLSNNVGGFVATNGSGATVDGCYTRYNIFAKGGVESTGIVGSFAGSNSGTISDSFASGKLVLTGRTVTYQSVFCGNNTGTMSRVMFDKSLSGSNTYDVYASAVRTEDIVDMNRYPELVTGASSDYSLTGFDFFPQIRAIVETYEENWDENDEPIPGDQTEMSRRYNALRGYSYVSAATMMIPNDQYMDNLPIVNYVANVASSSYATEELRIKAFDRCPNLSFNAENDSNDSAWTSSTTTVADRFAATTGGTGVATSYKLDAVSAGNSTVSFEKDAKDFNYVVCSKTPQLDLFVTVVNTVANLNFQGGDGTENNPYQISTADQVRALAFYGQNPNNYFEVINDIDMNDTAGTPWNEYINQFGSHLDGQGYAISDILIPANKSNGMFGEILNGAEIIDLGLSGIDVVASSGDAGLFASNAGYATISNCFAVGSLNHNGTASTDTAGGFIGLTEGTAINGVLTSGKVLAPGVANVGGVIGTTKAKTVSAQTHETSITDAMSTSFVRGKTNVGGIIGKASGTSSYKTLITGAVFANMVDAADAVNSAHNIVGLSEQCTVSNVTFDLQFATVDADVTETGLMTYKLTGSSAAAPVSGWSRYSGFTGYYVPAGFVSNAQTGTFTTGVQLAAAKISLLAGISSGTYKSFTQITAQATLNGCNTHFEEDSITKYLTLNNAGGNDPIASVNSANVGNVNAVTKVEYGIYDYVGETYMFDGGRLERYFEPQLSKVIQIDYAFSDVSSLLGSSAAAVMATDACGSPSTTAAKITSNTNRTGTLISGMMVSYDETAGCYSFVVGEKLPSGCKLGGVTATYNSGAGTLDVDGNTVKLTSGGAPIASNITQITISLSVVSDTGEWGIRTFSDNLAG